MNRRIPICHMPATCLPACSAITIKVLLVLLAALSLLLPLPFAKAEINASLQMLLGNPDSATASAQQNRQRHLIVRPQLAMSYNDSLRFPNWVSWHLSRSDIGSVSRGDFQPDPSLPSSFRRITPRDYSGSGYDRGHNCPHKDRSKTRKDNEAVFYMSNMTPQKHGMNGGPWENLESYCRQLAQQGNELYIYCGHGFERNDAVRKSIGPAEVAVPDFGWKIVVVLPEQAGDDRTRITAATRVIAVRMPNRNDILRDPWTRYVTTVADIERATGLRFFNALPTQVASTLKTKRDSGVSGMAGGRQNRGGQPTGSSQTPPRPAPETSTSSDLVWVNTRSGVYWRKGTQYYGKTKQGKFLTEKEALAQGYRAAKGQ